MAQRETDIAKRGRPEARRAAPASPLAAALEEHHRAPTARRLALSPVSLSREGAPFRSALFTKQPAEKGRDRCSGLRAALAHQRAARRTAQRAPRPKHRVLRLEASRQAAEFGPGTRSLCTEKQAHCKTRNDVQCQGQGPAPTGRGAIVGGASHCCSALRRVQLSHCLVHCTWCLRSCRPWEDGFRARTYRSLPPFMNVRSGYGPQHEWSQPCQGGLVPNRDPPA